MQDFTKQFDFSDYCDLTNESYIGTFVVKSFLTPLDEIKANRLYRDLLGTIDPVLVPKEIQDLAFVISQLNTRVVKYPSFFKNPDSIYNGGHLNPKILFSILERCIDIQDEFVKEQKEKRDALKRNIESKIKAKSVEKTDGEDEFTEFDEEDVGD